jgi:hypothetical protein
MQLSLLFLICVDFVQRELLHAFLAIVAIQQKRYQLVHGRPRAYQKALVLGVAVQHRVVDFYQTTTSSLQREFGIASWMATLQNRRSCFFVQSQMCPHSGFTDCHLHAQIEQLRVSVLHFVLAEEGAHHFFACRLEGDAEGLVLDVGAQTFRINFNGRLEENKIMVTKMKKKKVPVPGIEPEPPG